MDRKEIIEKFTDKCGFDNYLVNCKFMDSLDLYVDCKMCGNEVEIANISISSMETFLDGKTYVQDAFPDIPPHLREMFVSGLCDDCYPHDIEEEI